MFDPDHAAILSAYRRAEAALNRERAAYASASRAFDKGSIPRKALEDAWNAYENAYGDEVQAYRKLETYETFAALPETADSEPETAKAA